MFNAPGNRKIKMNQERNRPAKTLTGEEKRAGENPNVSEILEMLDNRGFPGDVSFSSKKD
jgi:hypothetical protein